MTYEEIEQQAFKHHRPSARSFGRQVYDIQQARIAELENACQAVLRNELNMGQIRAALWKPEPTERSE
jgi:hypothetical protein